MLLLGQMNNTDNQQIDSFDKWAANYHTRLASFNQEQLQTGQEIGVNYLMMGYLMATEMKTMATSFINLLRSSGFGKQQLLMLDELERELALLSLEEADRLTKLVNKVTDD